MSLTLLNPKVKVLSPGLRVLGFRALSPKTLRAPKLFSLKTFEDPEFQQVISQLYVSQASAAQNMDMILEEEAMFAAEVLPLQQNSDQQTSLQMAEENDEENAWQDAMILHLATVKDTWRHPQL